MSDQQSDFLIDPSRGGKLISGKTRSIMSELLDLEDEEKAPTPSPIPIDPSYPGLRRNSPQPSMSESTASTHLEETKETEKFQDKILDRKPRPEVNQAKSSADSALSLSRSSSFIPAVIQLTNSIIDELTSNPNRLLSLNPSRRDSIVAHLERLSNSPPSLSSAPTLSHPTSDTSPLKRWVDSNRTRNQEEALRTFFGEIALFVIAEAILLKSWSDRGIRRWSASDIGRLNWAINSAVRPWVPMDREGWQITKPNLYSWYSPNPTIQKDIWKILDTWDLSREDEPFFIRLFSMLPKEKVPCLDLVGYDPRFYQALWHQVPFFGYSNSENRTGLSRKKWAFSPTLRDGSLMKNSPGELQWVGLEDSAIHFFLAELNHLWKAPIAPPLWAIGTGLEVHTKDQLSLSLGAAKPSILRKIGEMEACDLAVVLEENVIRGQGRNPNSIRLRDQLEKLPHFKKLRSGGTSLGALQACVALNKLRPGGQLWWAREDCISAKEGKEVLSFFLDRAALVHEFDFTEIEHSLPVSGPLFPRFLYLFEKEPDLEARLENRPKRHCIRGQLRSHIEVDLLLEDALGMANGTIVEPRGLWNIVSLVSPSPQREWTEKWPDPTSHRTLRALDALRKASLPLAHFTTIRPTPEAEQRKGGWTVPIPLRGFWIQGEVDQEGRKLSPRALPSPGEYATGSGMMVLVSESSWIPTLKMYLESAFVREWLDHYAERRGEKWILSEQVLRWVPVPTMLLRVMGVSSSKATRQPPQIEETLLNPHESPSKLVPSRLSHELPPEWNRIIEEIPYDPLSVQEQLATLNRSETSEERLLNANATVFHHASHAIAHLVGNPKEQDLVQDGKIRWNRLLRLLADSEKTTLTLHPSLRITGSLPPHFPIDKIEKVKAPMPGILFATETGFTLHVGIEKNLFFQILWDQVQHLKHPTWNEILEHVIVPRRLEIAETTAVEVLNSHAEKSAKIEKLRDLLNDCQLF